jgi:hypothetical protein
MLPMMKYVASGDQARSYISAPEDLHMCFVRHVSLSSKSSLPSVGWWCSAGTHKMTLPSSPAEARVSPIVGEQMVSRLACIRVLGLEREGAAEAV